MTAIVEQYFTAAMPLSKTFPRGHCNDSASGIPREPCGRFPPACEESKAVPDLEYGGYTCDSSSCLNCHVYRLGRASDRLVPDAAAEQLSGFPRVPTYSRLDSGSERSSRSSDEDSAVGLAPGPSQADGGSYTATATSAAFNFPADSDELPAFQFEPAWSGRPDPAPAVFQEVATFGPTGQGPCRIVCSMDFSDDGRILATAGIAKQISVYSIEDYWQQSSPKRDAHLPPVATHRLPSKLSSLAWCPGSQGLVTVGDYDGVLCQLDLFTGHYVSDIDEHGGRRILSVAYSRLRAGLLASASEDCTARIWHDSSFRDCSVLCPSPGYSVCSVDFCSADENLLTLASADNNVYLYDLRNLTAPALKLTHHSRPVSYAKFLSRTQVISASVDSSIAMWDIANSGGAQNGSGTVNQPWRMFHGHRNVKNFVGLSVCPESKLIACGSETHSVFCYYPEWSVPLATRDLDSVEGVTESGFISAVCWQRGSGDYPVVAAASSQGFVKILSLHSKSGMETL